MMHHYNLSTRHVFQTRRSDVRSETLAALRSTIEVATGGHAVPLPGFPEYFLSIRNTWIGAVGWLIQGPEHRVMVQCVTAWTIEGTAKGVRWLGTELPEELDLPCCLVKLGLPLLKDPDSASWLEDAERCISWGDATHASSEEWHKVALMGVSPELGNQTQLRTGVPSINLSCMRLANFLQPECFGRLHVGRFKSRRRLYSGVEV